MTHIKGCFFDLSQSLYRKVQELGLKNRYVNNSEFSLTIKLPPPLAYLPPQHLLTALENT